MKEYSQVVMQSTSSHLGHFHSWARDFEKGDLTLKLAKQVNKGKKK